MTSNNETWAVQIRKERVFKIFRFYVHEKKLDNADDCPFEIEPIQRHPNLFTDDKYIKDVAHTSSAPDIEQESTEFLFS